MTLDEFSHKLHTSTYYNEKHLDEFYQTFLEVFGNEYNLSSVVVGKVYSLAWEHGHSSGLCDVFNYGLDFAGLAKSAYEEGLKGR